MCVVGVLTETMGETDWSAIMRLEDVKRLNEWFSGQRVNYDKVGYSTALVKVDSVENVLEVNDRIVEMGFQAYTPLSFVQESTTFIWCCNSFLAGLEQSPCWWRPSALPTR